MTTQFLTESEVAERTRISLGTLRRWRTENKGPRYLKFGSLVRYSEDDLTAWEANLPAGGSSIQRKNPTAVRQSPALRKAAL